MKTQLLAALYAMVATSALAEPGVEHWSATSSTAMGITGDIALSPRRITMAGKTLPLAVAADDPAFSTTNGLVKARVLKVIRPADPLLLHGNHLCKATWLVVWRETAFAQKNLDMAVFSGAQQPTGIGSPGLCATFMYSKP